MLIRKLFKILTLQCLLFTDSVTNLVFVSFYAILYHSVYFFQLLSKVMQSGWESFSRKLRRFDAYPKTLEDFRIKTFSGATVTLISACFMVLLMISEINYYLTVEVQPDLFVDMSQGDKLKININVTLHGLPCTLVSLDAIDVSGQRQIDIAHTLHKQRLNIDGSFAAEAELVSDIGKNNKSENTSVLDPNRCESCFGAEISKTSCCNTCQEIKEAYRRKGWAFPADAYTTMPQCEREGPESRTDYKIGKEGCMLYGKLEVNKVAGDFHISPGNSFELGHRHVHDIAGFGDKSKINVSHTINHLSFGEGIYPGQIHPLDGLKVISPHHESSYHYYVKIVPTTYVDIDGKTLKSNQFSVTRHQSVPRPSDNGGSTHGAAGVFVSYELSPMMVRYTEKSRSFLHFLTSVCAIVGGIFTVAGILDAFIYHGSAALQRKMELGKLT